MNNKDLTEDFSASNVYETLTGLLSGDIGAGVKLMEIGINSINSIPDYLFYRNLTAVLSELKSKGTANRKVGKKLAESAYGEKYGYTRYRRSFARKDGRDTSRHERKSDSTGR